MLFRVPFKTPFRDHLTLQKPREKMGWKKAISKVLKFLLDNSSCRIFPSVQVHPYQKIIYSASGNIAKKLYNIISAVHFIAFRKLTCNLFVFFCLVGLCSKTLELAKKNN